MLPDLSTFPSLAALVLDEMQVLLLRPATEATVVDTTVRIDVDSNAIRLRVLVPLESSADTLTLVVGLSAGGVTLFSGGRTIVVRPGPALGAPPQVPLTYVGPGANVASLSLVPGDTVLTLGGTLLFTPLALDVTGLPVPDFYVSWTSSDPSLAPVNALGLLQAPDARGTVTVTANTPSGASAATAVTFIPLPADIIKVLGDNQSGPPGQLLATPLAVEVRGADGLGITGIPVEFRTLLGGGRLVDSIVVTDPTGRAQTTASLGTLGLNTFQASVAGLPPVTFDASALLRVPLGQAPGASRIR